MNAARTCLLALMLLALVAAPGFAKPDADPEWTPQMWSEEDTLQFRTDCPDEGEHWSYVWLVVIDKDVYVRLGSRAAERIDCNKTKPIVAIRIADDLEFPAVEMVPAPDKADAVADAMAGKYWTDIFVRYSNHPYTMRLVPRAKGEVLGSGGDGKNGAGDGDGKGAAGGSAGGADAARGASGAGKDEAAR